MQGTFHKVGAKATSEGKEVGGSPKWLHTPVWFALTGLQLPPLPKSSAFSQRHLLTEKYFSFLLQALTTKMALPSVAREYNTLPWARTAGACWEGPEQRSIWGAPKTGEGTATEVRRAGELPAAAADELD